MRDILREYIEDYNSGRISARGLQARLNFEMWKEEAHQRKAEQCIPVPADYIKMARDPLENVIAEEDAREMMDKIGLLKDALDASDWQIVLLIVRGKTQETIAKILGASRATIRWRISKIKKAAGTIGLREILEPPESRFAAFVTKERIEYPFDFFRKHEEVKDGRKVIRCRVPEYLKECGCESVCCYCAKCTRKGNNGK